MHLICVVMAAPSSDVRNSIAAQLLNWGFANFSLYKNESKEIEPMRVVGGVSERCKIRYEGFACVLKKGEGSAVQMRYVLPEKISAPVKAGDEIGYIEYSCNGKIIGKSKICASESVEKISFWELFVRMVSNFVLN